MVEWMSEDGPPPVVTVTTMTYIYTAVYSAGIEFRSEGIIRRFESAL